MNHYFRIFLQKFLQIKSDKFALKYPGMVIFLIYGTMTHAMTAKHLLVSQAFLLLWIEYLNLPEMF